MSLHCSFHSEHAWPRLLPAVVLVVAVTALLPAPTDAQTSWEVQVENGAAFSGGNDVRIPGDSGTLFSLTDDLTSDTTYYWRVRASLRAGERHVISALVAPLEIHAGGLFERPVQFAGTTFLPGGPVSARYQFNSYRLTYRYEFVQTDRWRVGVGGTVKVRDAVIALRSTATGESASKRNLGVVPLVNFLVQRRLGPRAALHIEGDALAAPQGRAEDVFAGVRTELSRGVWLDLGYRVLEGGADNDEVYAFALIHYAAAGLVLSF
ncbi:MAG: hypothetical protein HOP14_14855 [Acidobacteria bacterium]|nr:hypothetical protein [Acidobacteriota bacterium]